MTTGRTQPLAASLLLVVALAQALAAQAAALVAVVAGHDKAALRVLARMGKGSRVDAGAALRTPPRTIAFGVELVAVVALALRARPAGVPGPPPSGQASGGLAALAGT